MAIEPVYRQVCLYNCSGLLAKSIAPYTPSDAEYVLFKGHRYFRAIYPTEIILPTFPLSIHKLRLWKRPDSSTLFWFIPAAIREAYPAGKANLWFTDLYLDAHGELLHPGEAELHRFYYVQHDQVDVVKNGENHIICTWDIDVPRPISWLEPNYKNCKS